MAFHVDKDCRAAPQTMVILYQEQQGATQTKHGSNERMVTRKLPVQHLIANIQMQTSSFVAMSITISAHVLDPLIPALVLPV